MSVRAIIRKLACMLPIAAVALAMPTQAQRGISRASTPEARATLHQAAACIAQSSEQETRELLLMDFRTPQYRSKMDRLIDNNRTCVRARWMRSNRLLIAGGLAEQLIESADQPLNVRLAAIPADRGTTPRSMSDAVMLCVSRSDPDGTGRLFAAEVGTEEEAAAASALAPALRLCATGTPLSVTTAGLRAMLATASFRLLAPVEG